MKKLLLINIIIASSLLLLSCKQEKDPKEQELKSKVNQYKEVVLTADLSHLSQSEREIIPLLISAAEIIDEIFWLQSFGNKEELMDILDGNYAKEYALINYGPWGRLEGHTAFWDGFSENKPLGAQFYPEDMTREEFDSWESDKKSSPYTLIKRAEDGSLYAVPYSQAYKEQYNKIKDLLTKASEIADYQPLSDYLKSLAQALLKDNFRESDLKWMKMKNNNIDLVMRPLDTGEDRKLGYKAAHSTYIVVKDIEWSELMNRFAGFAIELQKKLPVPEAYKQEVPGDNSEILVYDAIYYAGHCNAGPKIIALHLPQDAEVQRIAGTRNMKLKNVMEAKFEWILQPIGEMIIHDDQKQYVSSDAFFILTAFHEIAAAMTISNKVDGSGPVRESLREYHGVIDATVTDLMALYLINLLHQKGELTEKEFTQAYVTSFASILRSSRFGTAGAHGIAGMIRFNYFEKAAVFSRCDDTETFTVNVENMKSAVEGTLAKLMVIQGDGNYQAAKEIVEKYGEMPESLKKEIDRINNTDIPVDVYFKQGLEHLGL